MRCNSGAQLLGRHVFEVFPEISEADDGARNLRCPLADRVVVQGRLAPYCLLAPALVRRDAVV